MPLDGTEGPGGTGGGGSGGTQPDSSRGTTPSAPADPSGRQALPSRRTQVARPRPHRRRSTCPSPVRAPADKRWCEQVTVEFRDTGGTPARSGTVTFGTHVIGGPGIGRATVRSRVAPAPIGAGATREKTYTVCVDAWRVPWEFTSGPRTSPPCGSDLDSALSAFGNDLR